MPISKAQQRAAAKYVNRTYDRIEPRVPTMKRDNQSTGEEADQDTEVFEQNEILLFKR